MIPQDGRKRFRGIVLGADAEAARMRLDEGERSALPAQQYPPCQAGADRRADRATARSPAPARRARAIPTTTRRHRIGRRRRRVTGGKPLRRTGHGRGCRHRTPGTAAGRRCRRAREDDRARGGAGGHGAGHPEGRPRQVRAREGHPRHHRPQDRRGAPVPLDRGGRGRAGGERGDADPAAASPRSSSPSIKVGEFIDRPAAADRFRPHRRADRQAGDRAARARGRAQAAVRRVQGPRRRDHQRHRQAHRVRQPDGRPRPGRGAAAARRDRSRARASATATASAPTSTTCARNRAGRRSSCPAPIPASSPSCSRRKCRRSTTASSRSRRWPAIPAAAPRWR